MKETRSSDQLAKLSVAKLRETLGRNKIAITLFNILDSIKNEVVAEVAKSHFRALVRVLRGELV